MKVVEDKGRLIETLEAQTLCDVAGKYGYQMSVLEIEGDGKTFKPGAFKEGKWLDKCVAVLSAHGIAVNRAEFNQAFLVFTFL